MSNKKKIFIGLGVVLLALIVFSIYNNPDRKGNQITLPPEQQAIVDSLVPKATKLQPINAKVKVDTANLVNLINAAETAGLDNFEFNSSSKTLLESATALQVELDSLLSFLNESRTVMAGSQIQNVWDTLIEVFNFRNEHNQKLIQMAKMGATIDFDNDVALEKFTNLATELETIELRLPEMESKLITALAELDPGTGEQVERQLEKQKSETSQLIQEKPSGWVQVSSPDSELTMSFPAGYKFEEHNSPGSIPGYSYLVYTDGETGSIAYAVKYENYEKVFADSKINYFSVEQRQEFLKQLAESLKKDLGTGLSNFSTKPGSIREYYAIKFSGDLSQGSKQGKFEGYIVLVGRTAYTLSTIYTNGSATEFKRILESFALRSSPTLRFSSFLDLSAFE